MKLFYTRRCCWEFNKLNFDSYKDAILYAQGYYRFTGNRLSDFEELDEIEQKENVKIFAYEYDANTEMLKVAQVVWKYEGEPQYNTYWTNELRKTHLTTVKTRLQRKPLTLKLSKEAWEKALYTSREKLVEKTFYKYYFELNRQIDESYHAQDDEISEYGEDVEDVKMPQKRYPRDALIDAIKASNPDYVDED